MVAKTDSKSLKLIYEGSVKRLWTIDSDDQKLFFDFTDDYSIFDWGKMPDQIANKGLSLTIMGAFFFEEFSKKEFWSNLKNSKNFECFDSKWIENIFLTDTFQNLETNGLPHHYKGLFDGETSLNLRDLNDIESLPQLYLEVLKAKIFYPEKVDMNSQGLYFYPADTESYRALSLIPLEVVFRFGMPQGSSLAKRLKTNSNYYRELGLSTLPEEGKLFDRPVIEFFTKLEATDRYLSWQEAIELSRLNRESFKLLTELTYLISLALFDMFKKTGITLFDGKFEFVQERGDTSSSTIYLADSIGPDELRLIYKDNHLSKELVRQYYQNSAWAKALSKAKEKAKVEPSKTFKDICIEEYEQKPATIEDEPKQLIDMLYPAITNTICQKKYFKNTLCLDNLVESFNSVFVKDTNN